MRHLLLLLFLVMIFILNVTAITSAIRKSYEGYKVFIVSPKSLAEQDIVKLWEDENGIDFWDPLHRTVNETLRVMVSPEMRDEFMLEMKRFGIYHQEIIGNVESSINRERTTNFNKQQNKITLKDIIQKHFQDFSYFWTWPEISNYLDKIAKDYPKLVKLEIFGKSYEGRPLKAIKISQNGKITGKKPVIFIDATVHAREWIGTMFSIYIINQLVENYQENRDMLDCVDWIIVPVVNVDGFVYTHEVDRFWRKTRSINSKSPCIGVDANRNFDFKWDSAGGSKSKACSMVYRGSAPNSEVEVKSLSKFLVKNNSTKLYISLHSFGNYILYPWGYDNIRIENYREHESLGESVRTAIRSLYGTHYRLGNAAATLYKTSGVSHDFAAAQPNIDFSFTFELPGGGAKGFDIEAQRIGDVNVETFAGIREFGKFISEKYGNSKKLNNL